MKRTILHCDINGFYASVECALDTRLRDKPVVVAGNPKSRRGVIISKNIHASKYGINVGENVSQALKKCPKVVVVRPKHDIYKKYSLLINEIYSMFSDQVEPYGLDESWIDVTNVEKLFGSGKTIADNLRKIVKEKLNLTVSVGVSFNKVFAKLGSDYKKPDATTLIPYECYEEIVYPLPVSMLLYVGKMTNLVLKELHINTIGELACYDPEILSMHLGKLGVKIWRYANGEDDCPVQYISMGRDAKSIGKGSTFKHDLVGVQEIRMGAYFLASEVAYRLRRSGLKCQRISVIIKNSRRQSISRQAGIEPASQLASTLCKVTMDLIIREWSGYSPIRSLTITAQDLVEEQNVMEQLSFFSDIDYKKLAKQDKLEESLYRLREKFGAKIIQPAIFLRNDLGIFDED